tara:strand:+ start:12141 stop:13520 length:1380 start_codon:yes stop_codon:yes gene_type:complete
MHRNDKTRQKKRERPGVKSLRRWLTQWLAALAFLGLGVVCSVIYFATTMSFIERQDSTLGQYQKIIQHLIEEVVTQGDIETLRHKLDDFFFGRFDLRLELTLRGERTTFPKGAIAERAEQLRSVDFEMPARWLSDGVMHVTLALDTSADATMLTRLAWTLFASALGGTLLVSYCGARLVRHSLEPVNDLAAQAKQLVPERLSERLDGQTQAEEFQPLIMQFNAVLERLERAYVQLEAFNADVAHELRTPLATLIGQTELALTGTRSSEDLLDFLGSNLEELQRLSGLINDMLFLAQVDRGISARAEIVHSIADLASEVLEYHEAALAENGLRSTVLGDASVAADRALLRRALSNLLSNAARYGCAGTCVTVRIGVESGEVLLSVENVGEAIPPEEIDRIFDRFYRHDVSREHRQENNFGLGLSIVAAIARMHGGSVFAHSDSEITSVGLSLVPARRACL